MNKELEDIVAGFLERLKNVLPHLKLSVETGCHVKLIFGEVPTAEEMKIVEEHFGQLEEYIQAPNERREYN